MKISNARAERVPDGMGIIRSMGVIIGLVLAWSMICAL